MHGTGGRVAPTDGAALVAAARELGPDRLPDRPGAAEPDSLWVYGPGEYESAQLVRIVAEGFAVNRFVHYSDNFGRPSGRSRFRSTMPAGELRIRSTGTVSATLDGRDLPLENRDGDVVIRSATGGVLVIEVTAPAGEPAAFALDLAECEPTPWHCEYEGTGWQLVPVRQGRFSHPPHLDGEPTVPIALEHDDATKTWWSEAAVLAFVTVSVSDAESGSGSGSGDERLRVMPGESIDESFAADDESEVEVELVRADGGWRSRYPLAFEWLRVDAATGVSVSAEACVRPAPRRGGFLCDDDELNRIWSVSAYTARLCMQRLTVDGIKRDRMPWIGDQALGIMANAYSLADAEIARDGLVALGRVNEGYINGIADYSLWWVIAQEEYLDHFGDLGHLAREAGAIDAALTRLADDAGRDGVFRPVRHDTSFADAGPGSVFLDWGVVLEEGRDSTALQLLWYRALTSGARVLGIAGHPGSARWSRLAETVEKVLRGAFDDRTGTWRPYLDVREADRPSPYPGFLAALAGFEVDFDAAAGEGTGTPFMRALALLAAGRSGDREGAIAAVRRDWGAMLRLGATAFWEDFSDSDSDSETDPQSDSSPYAMYGRPFGKSLAHGWSAGPAALLPRLVLGLRPTAPGWSRFEVDPRLGELGWAGASVPVSGGDIVVLVEGDVVSVNVPEGHALQRGDEVVAGPRRVEWSLRRPTGAAA